MEVHINTLKLKNILSVLDDYDVFLFDLWGVIIEGDQIYPGVVEVINYILLDKQVYFVTNAPRSAIDSFGVIKSWGINTNPENVITAGEIARQLITSKIETDETGSVIFHLGSDQHTEILSGLDIKTTEDIAKANILLITLHRDHGANLDEFDDLLKFVSKQQNITSICANPDTILKNRGSIRYASGYFAEKLKTFGSDVIYTGKPYPEIYNSVFAKLQNIPKNRILMIGDTMETDILGANKAGIHSALVLTGNAEKFHTSIATEQETINALHKAAVAANVMPNFLISLI